MYKDFKKSETLDTGFAGGTSLLWMFSGIVLGLLVGLGMYFFSNDKMPKVSMIDSLEKKIQKVQTDKSTNNRLSNKPDPANSSMSSFNALEKPNKVKEQERKNKFSYYAVLPNLDVPVGNAKPINTSGSAPAQTETVTQTTESSANKKTEETVAVIEEAEEKIKPAAIGDYLLQVASFKKQSMANKTRGRLSNKGIDAYIQKKKIKGRYWYRVVAGPVDQYSVDSWKNTAEKLGHKPLVISVR